MLILTKKKKGRELTQSFEKSHYTNRKFEKANGQQKDTKNFDYTTTADRLRTVSWE